MKLEFIEATTIPDSWFQGLQKVLENGSVYLIDKGSYEGQKRLEFDHVTIRIKYPASRPLLPECPPGCGVPNPASNEYLENYLQYLFTSYKNPGEFYTYGSYLEKQIEKVIEIFKNGDYGTNQACMTVGDQYSLDLEDPPCVLPDALITTKRGLVRADLVQIGDEVLTHKGRFKKILQIYRRSYKGKMIYISTNGFNYSTYLTPEHPVFAVNVERCPYDDKLKCKPSCKKQHSVYGKYGCKQLYNNYKRDWIASKDIKEKLSFLPIPCLNTDNVKCPYSEDEMYLFGLFLAEGDYLKNKSGIRFNLGAHETDIISKTIKLMKKVYNINMSSNDNSQLSCARLNFYSVDIANKFYSMFGAGARNKTIPMEFVCYSKENIKHLFEGFIDGDGYRKEKCEEFFTSSDKLSSMFKLLLQKMFIIPSSSKVKVNDSEINGRIIKSNGDGYYFNVYTKEKQKNMYWVDDDYMYVSVKNKKEINYNGFVYNYEVEDDNSYTVDGIVVHNCLKIVDCRVRDGKLHFIIYFRSNDLWNGYPVNIASLQLLKEYIAESSGLEDGEIIYTSKGLHLYNHAWDLAKSVVGGGY